MLKQNIGAEGQSPSAALPRSIGEETLLGVSDVCDITGLAEATASKLMKETGRAFRLHGRLFILWTSFVEFLSGREGML